MSAFFRRAIRLVDAGPAALALALVLGLVVACDQSTTETTPFRPLSVKLTAVSGAPTVTADSIGNAAITCQYQLTAVATGTDQASWIRAVIRWNIGGAHPPADSQFVSSEAMHSLWGRDTLPNDTPVETSISVSAAVPYTADLVMYFKNLRTSELDSTAAVLSCIPPAASDPTPLAISGVTLTPDVVEPGDTLHVGFTTRSGAGLWKTVVVLSGAKDTTRQVFYEQAAKGVVHDVAVRIPPGATLGETFTVELSAEDLTLKEVSTRLPVGPLVDVTPPTLTAELQGQYAEGDTIHLGVTARDNQRLRWIVYTLGAPANIRDSIAMVDTAVTDFHVDIPVQQGWVGSPTLTMFARDPSGLTSVPVVSAPGAIRIYPTVTRPIRTGSLDGQLTDVVLDEKRQLIYVAQAGQKRVAVVSMQTLTSVAFVALPSTPSGLDVSVGGDSLVVALTDARALAVIDLASGGYPLTLIQLTAADTAQKAGKPLGIRIAANGKALVPLDGGLHWTRAQTLEVDFAAGTQRVRTDLPLSEAETVSRSGDRSALVVGGLVFTGNTGGSCGYRYLAATDSFGPCHGAAYGRLESTMTGSFWTSGSMLMAADLSNIRTLYLPGYGIGLSPDGQLAYLTGHGWALAERISDGVVLERAAFGPRGLTLVTADGSTLLTFEDVYSSADDHRVNVGAMTLK